MDVGRQGQGLAVVHARQRSATPTSAPPCASPWPAMHWLVPASLLQTAQCTRPQTNQPTARWVDAGRVGQGPAVRSCGPTEGASTRRCRVTGTGVDSGGRVDAWGPGRARRAGERERRAAARRWRTGVEAPASAAPCCGPDRSHCRLLIARALLGSRPSLVSAAAWAGALARARSGRHPPAAPPSGTAQRPWRRPSARRPGPAHARAALPADCQLSPPASALVGFCSCSGDRGAAEDRVCGRVQRRGSKQQGRVGARSNARREGHVGSAAVLVGSLSEVVTQREGSGDTKRIGGRAGR